MLKGASIVAFIKWNISSHESHYFRYRWQDILFFAQTRSFSEYSCFSKWKLLFSKAQFTEKIRLTVAFFFVINCSIIKKSCCSNGEPLKTLCSIWMARGLNPRPPAPETTALPLDHLPVIIHRFVVSSVPVSTNYEPSPVFLLSSIFPVNSLKSF